MPCGEFLEICAHLLWPVSCPVCGAVGVVACDGCLRSLFRRLPLAHCLLCGVPVPCAIHGSGCPKIRAGTLHGGIAREMILALKYRKHEALAFRLGQALAKVFAAPDSDVLVPVPLHLKSRRPYNQAGAIARGLGSVWGIEVWDGARWALDIPTRAGMGQKERIALSRSAFEFDLDAGENLSGLRMSFVDDVSTTGTTLYRLAEVARKQGAEVAGAFVIARSGADM